jgi:tetratricopeptide (TPR) repeat protein
MGGPQAQGKAPSLFATDPGQSDKIRALLTDGDRACQQGEYQEAIDIWSRIFLIDIRNEGASKKIEEAKVLLAEQDRKTEELFNLAVGLLNQGKKDEARKKFDEVLSYEPHHLAARNYLRQLDDETAAKDKAASPLPMDLPPAPEEMLLPPAPAVRIEEAPKPKKKLWIPAVIAVVLISLLFLGWKFLGGGATSGKKNVDAAAVIAQAESLYKQGRIADALSELAKVPLEDPLHNKAIQLISDYRLGPKKKGTDTIDGRPAEVVAAEWRAQALQAYQNKDYTRAQDLYTKSTQVRQLSLEDRAYLDDINRTLDLIQTGQSSFDSGNFEQAITLLKPIYEKERVIQARDILVKAYYNQGLNAMKEESLPRAEAAFQEILRIDEADEMTQKNLRLINRYKDVNKDLLFRTYIKYLKPR